MPLAVAISKVTPPAGAGAGRETVKVKVVVPELPSLADTSLMDNCDGVLVRAKFTGMDTPGVMAATLYGPPAVPLAVAVTLAVPPEIVAGLPLMAALAPLPGGVNVTVPPFTGSPALFAVTVKPNGLVKALLITALWPEPLRLPRVNPFDSNAPISQAEPTGRATPRWSVSVHPELPACIDRFGTGQQSHGLCNAAVSAQSG